MDPVPIISQVAYYTNNLQVEKLYHAPIHPKRGVTVVLKHWEALYIEYKWAFILLISRLEWSIERSKRQQRIVHRGLSV